MQPKYFVWHLPLKSKNYTIMKKVLLMVALAFSVAATSCCKEPVFGDDPRDRCGNGRDPKPTACEALKVDDGSSKIIDCLVNENIQRAWIEGDNLKIEVAYGGCNQHDFYLRWSGAFMKSSPPQAT